MINCIATFHRVSEKTGGYLQYGANALCRVENFTIAVSTKRDLRVSSVWSKCKARTLQLLSQVVNLLSGHEACQYCGPIGQWTHNPPHKLVEDRYHTLPVGKSMVLDVNNLPMPCPVSSSLSSNFTRNKGTDYFGFIGQASEIHEPKRKDSSHSLRYMHEAGGVSPSPTTFFYSMSLPKQLFLKN